MLLITPRRTVSTEMPEATTRVASARQFSFKCARRRNVASFATLKTDCRIRFQARAIRLKRLRSGYHVS